MPSHISFQDIMFKYPQMYSLHSLDRYKSGWDKQKLMRFQKLERIYNNPKSRHAIEFKVLISLFIEFEILNLPRTIPKTQLKSDVPISPIYAMGVDPLRKVD